MADAPKLKDFFTDEVVRSVGERVASALPSFDVDAFIARVLAPAGEPPFGTLEFTARSRRIADAIDEVAGLEPPDLFDVLVRSLPPELDGTDGALNDGFSLWPYGDLIGRHGADHPTIALDASKALTTRFTAEFAVRPVLAAWPDALDTLAEWVDDPNQHVRRLVSEGTRPRLPWAARLALPLERVLPLLTALRADPSPYVRRSVANHLNDLAKEHPDLIIELLAGWHAEGPAETRWIVRHALRNHLKDGTPGALAIFGYAPPEVGLGGFDVRPDPVAIGGTIDVGFSLRSHSTVDQLLMIDLVMGFVKANGATSPKVFKFREVTLAAGAEERFGKSFDMVERSTRRLHPGRHTVGVRVNGVDVGGADFDLVAD